MPQCSLAELQAWLQTPGLVYVEIGNVLVYRPELKRLFITAQFQRSSMNKNKRSSHRPIVVQTYFYTTLRTHTHFVASSSQCSDMSTLQSAIPVSAGAKLQAHYPATGKLQTRMLLFIRFFHTKIDVYYPPPPRSPICPIHVITVLLPPLFAE